MCGVIGLYGRKNVFPELYSGLLTLQHRGQNGAGMITYENSFHLKKGRDFVSKVFEPKHARRLKGNIGIGHVRYPTVGPGKEEDVQPFYVNRPYGIAIAHNGNLTNYKELRRELPKEKWHIESECDVEVILKVFAEELDRLVQNGDFSYDKIFKALEVTYKRVEGSFSVVTIIAGRGLLAFRDPYGIKPLIFGRKDKNFCFASESVVLDVLGYEIERDVRPGEAIFINRKKKVFSQQITDEVHYPCIFEYVYFARPDSVIDGIDVYEARFRLGEELAHEVEEKDIRPDVVIPIPDTARAAALSLANTSGIPYREGLIKNRYVGRTFIMPDPDQSKVRMKLNPIRREIEGKKVLLVDDSVVRGNTSKKIIALVKSAKPRKIYFASSSPPLRYPCPYGIDMQTRGEFIARDKSESEIQKEIGADVLIYQSLDGLIKGVRGNSTQRFCTACFNGNYPTHVSQETLREIEQERMKAKK